jgi:predicted phage terminase large subunit-like protein
MNLQLRMDFCVHCEQRYGTLTLYRRFNAYGTTEIIDAVHAAVRTPELRRSEAQVRLLVTAKQDKAPESNEEVVQREMMRRELAKRRLIYFTTEMMPEYKPGWVHQDICRRLELFVKRVEAQQAPRLMLFMPPRHGKSQLASGMFPAWVLGQHPEWKIIAASYAQSLSNEFSAEVRSRLRDPEYQAIFPTRLDKEHHGVEAWKTTKGGGYLSAGVGSGITGKGMHIGIADDIIKGAAEADSELVRASTFKWYNSEFRNRLAPGGGILYIGTRWHHDDPAGRLLNVEAELRKAGVPPEEREDWEIVSYPAIAEMDEYLMVDGTILQGTPEIEDMVLRMLRRVGEALTPERYPLNELKKIKNAYTKSQWTALYQQAPTPDDGDFFKRDDLKYRWLDPMYRPLCRTFMCVDYAIGKKQRNDFTVIAVFALDANDDLYVLEMRRGRWGTRDIVSNIVAMVDKHNPEVYAGEQGAIHHAVWPLVLQALEPLRKFISVDETLVPIQDKEVRARPLQGRTQRGKLIFSYDSSTAPEVYDITERELLQFPNGVHDDTVDVLAWGARLALNTALPQMQAPPPQASWKDELELSSSSNSYMEA